MEEEKQEKRCQDGSHGLVKYSPEGLESKCKQYFSICDDDGKKYTLPGLILYLDIAESTFHLWVSDDKGDYGELSKVLKKAILRMRDDLEQRADTMSLFRLKQCCYGGYSDRPVEDSGHGIQVNVSFGKGDGKVAAEYGK